MWQQLEHGTGRAPHTDDYTIPIVFREIIFHFAICKQLNTA